MDDFVKLVTNVGIPTALLVTFLYFLWKAGRWAAEKVVSPIVGSHTDLIKALQERIPKQDEKLEEIKTATKEMVTKLDNQTVVLKSSIDTQTRILAQLDGPKK